MAVSVENIGHGTLSENHRPPEDHDDTGIKTSLPTRDDRPLQKSQSHAEERPAIAASPRSSSSMPSSPEPLLWTRAAQKRTRPIHDVDGPHTEFLSCKKRRLRRDLITSRLSRPYSMPATHIIHREASASGDKRFMKLAAVARSKKLNAVVVPTPEDYGTRMPTNPNTGCRPQRGPVVPLNQTGSHHMQASSEIVRRAAILNRIRLRVRDERRGSVGLSGVAEAPSVVVSNEQGMVVSNRSQVGNDRPLMMNACCPQGPVAMSRNWDSTTAGPAAEAHEQNHNPNNTNTSDTLPPNPSSTASAADVLHLGRLSPRLKPLRSPELRPFSASSSRGAQITRPMDEDQLDDDSLSFPGSSVLFAADDDEAGGSSLDGDEDDDIYADFSIIFGGGGGPTGNEDSGGDGGGGDGGGGVHHVPVGTEHFEDYMDDLDGIPWAVR